MTERVFADTNLFLRFITRDVPEQSDGVKRLFRRAEGGEIVWTLERFYRLARPAIRERVLAILNTPGIEVIGGDQVLQSINWYVDKNISYGDAQNAAWLIAQGIETVYTFDRKHFSRIEGITVRVPAKES